MTLPALRVRPASERKAPPLPFTFAAMALAPPASVTAPTDWVEMRDIAPSKRRMPPLRVIGAETGTRSVRSWLPRLSIQKVAP